MSVASNHFLGLVPDPSVDDALINAACGTVRTERMPEDMPAAKFLPLRMPNGPLKVIMSFIASERPDLGSLLFASNDASLMTECKQAAGVSVEPVAEYLA